MRYTALALLLLLPLLTPPRARAQEQGFDYDSYEPRTLAEVISKYDNEAMIDPKMKDGSTVFGAPFKSRVRVTYTGASRKIPAARKQFIGEWVKVHGADPRFEDLFESEWAFAEGDVEYWLPVQKQVAAYFGKELKKGEAIDLYVFILGGRRVAGRWEWVIAVNEFDKAGASSAAAGGSPGK